MGVVYSGVPLELAKRLRTASGARTFIETGTYLGDTAAWAAREFDRVVTVEASAELHRQARERHAELRNIEFRLGDSRTQLSEILKSATPPAILWIDSHWSGGPTYGAGDECPLIEELSIIAEAGGDHIILIDDARLFLAPPPSAHNADAWPTISEVMAALDGRYTIVLEDVIISVPHALRPTVLTYAREVIDRAQARPLYRRALVRVQRGVRKVVRALRGRA